ncbi:hypothetical protein PAMP_013007 [Pampus punctatissimus]
MKGRREEEEEEKRSNDSAMMDLMMTPLSPTIRKQSRTPPVLGRRTPLCHNVLTLPSRRGLMRLPVCVTDRVHKQLNAWLGAVWQPPPLPVQTEALLTLMSWRPVREERGPGRWRCSHTPTPLM